MSSSWWWRALVLFLAFALSVGMVLPTALNLKEDSPYPIKSKINLGLDLQGGLYMILGIDFDKVYVGEVKNWARKIEGMLLDRDIQAKVGRLEVGASAEERRDPRHSIILSDPNDAQRAKEEIRKWAGSYVRLTAEQGGELQYALGKTLKMQIEEQAVGKSIEVIRNRIDEFGVTEPEIISQGSDRIIVQLPGVRDIERAKALIGKTAKLEFKLVNDDIPAAKIQEWLERVKKSGPQFKKGDRFSEYLFELNNFLIKDLPDGYGLAFEKRATGPSKAAVTLEQMVPYLVENVPRLTGDALADAQVQIDQQKNQPYVSLDFKSAGGSIFEELTGANIGKRMAIVLDGNVYSAPVIQTRIAGGRAQITLGQGGYNKLLKEARDLALVLRAGALPVELDFLEQRTVGPSLGQDSIEKARYAALIGAILVFLFLLFYYRIAGSIAVFTLGLNVLFVLACLVAFEATLTLPGIAGIALTIGMAVDANIIIYERIREEVKKGLGFYKAVEGGFSQAFWTIIDANITTALAGICLLNFGTGPIRGFAVTLLIGIVATVYSSYFVGRLLFEFYMNKVEGQKLSI